jgi:hypothetical protein
VKAFLLTGTYRFLRRRVGSHSASTGSNANHLRDYTTDGAPFVGA